jgi:predicted RNA-binding protein YlxR (DUF448 family)
MENTRKRADYTRKTRNLMNQDTCINGHDVTDKDLMVGQRTDRNGRTSYICKACSALNQKKARPGSKPYNGMYRDEVTLKPDLRKTLRVLIHDRIADASETDLLAIYHFVTSTIPQKEEN